MEKSQAIKDAIMTAAISKQDQMVFRFVYKLEPAGCEIHYDYTHANLWPHRKSRSPPTTFVADVKYDKQPEK